MVTVAGDHEGMVPEAGKLKLPVRATPQVNDA
jgi:hypothetical protein